MNKLDNRYYFIFLVLLHVGIGAAGNYNGPIVGVFYLTMFLIFSIDVVMSRDSESKAGFYALYLMGFEIVYRMAGTTFSYEFGKYISSLILVLGVIVGRRKYVPWVYIGALLLLVPALFLVEAQETDRIRKMILFNLSGPLCIVFSGLYFYKRKVDVRHFYKGMQFAFLPAFSLIVLLSLKAGLSTLQFESISSNPEASGGFGANQVSSAIGWFVFLALVVKVQRRNVTPFNLLDWGILLLLVIRGLLTMSRGGMMSAVLGLLVAVFYYYYVNHRFRITVFKLFPYILMGILLLGIGVWYANKISNNYLLYRYQGKTTREVTEGIVSENKSYLTGRDDIMKGDLAAFMEFPVLGVGYGMSDVYHLAYFGSAAAAHTEFARLLSENGSLGLIFMIILFIVLPLKYFFSVRSVLSKYFMIAFFIVSMTTMFHGAMRLSLAGIVYGASFMVLVESKKEE